MKRVSKSGHDKNVSNYQEILSFCIGNGAKYNPSNPDIMIVNMKVLEVDSLNALDGETAAEAHEKHVYLERKEAFRPIEDLCRDVVNFLGASGGSKEKLHQGKIILNRLRGSNKKNNKEDAKDESTVQEKQATMTFHSTYDERLEALDEIIQLVMTEEKYKPNEFELSVEGLKVKLVTLKEKNYEMKQAIVQVSNSRIQRDKVLYLSKTNAHQVVLEVKQYVKAIFGPSSAEYKQIKSIPFRKIPTTI